MIHRSLLRALFVVVAPCASAAEPPPEPRFEPAEIRADFDALRAGLEAAHFDLYARRRRPGYDALHARMRAGFDAPMTLDAIELAFQRYVAYGNVAHARIDAAGRGWEAYRAAGGTAFPLYLRVVAGRVHVERDLSGVDGLAAGDRVVSIDGTPARAWLDRMRSHLSADNDYLAYTLLETSLPRHVWIELGTSERYTVVVEKRDGRRVERRIPARTRAEFEAAEAKLPPAFALDWNTREARMLDGGIAYLRPGPFYDNRSDAPHPWDPSAFRAFVDEAFRRFLDAGADHLLLDLRDNPGGDNSFSDPLVAWFATKPFRFTDAFEIKVSAATIASNAKRLDGSADAISAKLAAAYARSEPGEHVRFEIPTVEPREGRRFGGKVHVLVNRHSYSNTVMVAAIVQDYGFGRILGEETADLASTYGAMESFALPRTGIVVGYPKARILRPNGDARPRGVIPDVAIATPIGARGSDVVLERALAIVRGARARPGA